MKEQDMIKIPVSELKEGDTFVARPGGRTYTITAIQNSGMMTDGGFFPFHSNTLYSWGQR